MNYEQFDKPCFIDVEDTLYLLGGWIVKDIFERNGVLERHGL